MLKPFVSFIVLKLDRNNLTASKNADAAIAALKEIQKRLGIIKESPNLVGKDDHTNYSTRAYSYSRLVQASWTSDPDIQDIQHHLVLVLATTTHIALHLSDSKLQGFISADLTDCNKASHLLGVRPISREVLGAAFLTGGPTRTLWLSGVHGKTPLKADTKLLSGIDLEYALDPFEDQSFWWTAARAKPKELKKAVGASAVNSRVWMAPTKCIAEFEVDTLSLLKRLEGVKIDEPNPYSILATPETKIDLTKLYGAYDLSLFPPQPGLYPHVEQSTIDNWESDALATSFEVIPNRYNTKSANLTADVVFNGQSIGELDITVSTTASLGRVAFKVRERPTNPPSDDLSRIARAIKNGHEVNIRYASEFSISRRLVFPTPLKLVPFEFQVAHFDDYLISREKPSSLDQVGKEKSLFCWTFHNYTTGWLICDDGSMEIADFIHVSGVKENAIDITLIHVKASHTDAKNRGISVSAYEVVSAQAIKNLRWATKLGLADGIGKPRRSRQVWKDGKKTSPEVFKKYIRKIKAIPKFKVLIIQPSLRKENLSKAKSDTDRLKIDQLKFLLASAQRTCFALGADFGVLIDN